MILILSFYVTSNFTVAFIPLLVHLACFVSWPAAPSPGGEDGVLLSRGVGETLGETFLKFLILVARFLGLLTVVDFVCPFKMPGHWLAWWWWTNDTAGKGSYFKNAEVVSEFANFKEEKNYLMVYHPHGLFGIA